MNHGLYEPLTWDKAVVITGRTMVGAGAWTKPAQTAPTLLSLEAGSTGASLGKAIRQRFSPLASQPQSLFCSGLAL